MRRPGADVPNIDGLQAAVLVGKILEVFATEKPGREEIETGLGSAGRGKGGADKAAGGLGGLRWRGGTGGKLARGAELAG